VKADVAFFVVWSFYRQHVSTMSQYIDGDEGLKFYFFFVTAFETCSLLMLGIDL